MENVVVSWSGVAWMAILGEGITTEKFFPKIRVVSCTDNEGYRMKWCVMKCIIPHLMNGTFIVKNN